MEMEKKRVQKEPALMVPVEVLRDLVHDIRNPLVAALGFLALLEKVDSPPAARRYAAALRESIETINGILKDARKIYGGMGPG